MAAKYESPLSSRYASAYMLNLFSSDKRIETWRRLWVSLAKAEMELGLPITQSQIDELEAHITDIDFACAAAREKEVRHDVMAHVYAYGLVAIALLPQVYLIYLSFRKTNPGGEVFQPGFSLDSYRYVFDRMGNTIWNTIRICGSALILIIALAVLISYLTVRRRNVLNACIDTLSMVPYIIPGAVVGISLILAFNNPVLPLVGTATIMIVSMCIRRIPYTIRSSVAILAQIPLSIDEAAESLGAGKVKTLLKVTLPMMFSGVFAGAVMSWVTLITELSSSLLLYSFRTQTLNVAVYKAVGNGTDGRACALATIVTVFTVISLLIFNKISKDGEIML